RRPGPPAPPPPRGHRRAPPPPPVGGLGGAVPPAGGGRRRREQWLDRIHGRASLVWVRTRPGRPSHCSGPPHPSFFSFRQVLAALATNRPASSLTSHSTYPRVPPAFTTFASAVSVAPPTPPRTLI